MKLKEDKSTILVTSRRDLNSVRTAIVRRAKQYLSQGPRWHRPTGLVKGLQIFLDATNAQQMIDATRNTVTGLFWNWLCLAVLWWDHRTFCFRETSSTCHNYFREVISYAEDLNTRNYFCQVGPSFPVANISQYGPEVLSVLCHVTSFWKGKNRVATQGKQLTVECTSLWTAVERYILIYPQLWRSF